MQANTHTHTHTHTHPLPYRKVRRKSEPVLILSTLTQTPDIIHIAQRPKQPAESVVRFPLLQPPTRRKYFANSSENSAANIHVTLQNIYIYIYTYIIWTFRASLSLEVFELSWIFCTLPWGFGRQCPFKCEKEKRTKKSYEDVWRVSLVQPPHKS